MNAPGNALLRALLAGLVLLLLGACAGEPPQPRATIEVRPLPARTLGDFELLPPPESADQRMRRLLYEQFEQWQGTRHVLGGTTREGIDCSGYVRDTFETRFGITLPRTTAGMATRGHRIERDALQAGDLVFFRIGRGGKHVGIYLEDGRFMHTSRVRGVTISKLSNRYWRKNYWQARRLGES